ncbi:hypothetical protein DL764_000114 [Monosporascus ibericus]|uniref:Uncharacterized protein n=1 Tax=Monosporascus ibericus TaxID=155417 RepID=A0A4Q4TUR7_9PEZI|nr:hypothetical protein DL764_000114 [Monosporascus ibericus]
MAALVLSFKGCSEDETGSHPGKHCIWTRKRKYFDIYASVVDYIRDGFAMPNYSNIYRRCSRNASREREEGKDIQLETIGRKRTRDIRAPDVDDAPCMSGSQESILRWTQPSGGIVRTDHIVISGEERKSDEMNIDIWNDEKRV